MRCLTTVGSEVAAADVDPRVVEGMMSSKRFEAKRARQSAQIERSRRAEFPASISIDGFSVEGQ
jgi:hypothetical protein